MFADAGPALQGSYLLAEVALEGAAVASCGEDRLALEVCQAGARPP
jgi:hypothetical protein